MAKSAALLVTFVLLGLFSFQAAAQSPTPAPVAGGPVPSSPPVPTPPAPTVAPVLPPTPVATPTPTPTATFTPTPTPTLTPTPVAEVPTVEAPGPSPAVNGVGSRQAWSGIAVASVIVAAMVM